MARESTLIITELTGAKRELFLRGAGLPLQGANWGGELRVETTWYPGNGDEATQTVLGPTEIESDWDGVWRTTQLSRSPQTFDPGAGNGDSFAIVRASQLVEAFESIVRSGNRLRVAWVSTVFSPFESAAGPQQVPEDFEVVREGRCIEWDFEFDRPDDVRWSATFSWQSRGLRQQRVLTARNDARTAILRQGIVANESAITEANIDSSITVDRDNPLSANRFTLGQLENFVNAPLELTRSFTRTLQQITDRLRRIGALVERIRSLPFQLQNQLLDSASNTVSQTNSFVDSLSRRPAEQNTRDQRLASLVRSTSYFGARQRDARNVLNNAVELRRQAQQANESQRTILAVHVSRATETLASISIRYYNTPDQAPSIAKANRLPLNQLDVERGSILIIPTLDAIRNFTPSDG